MRTAIRASHVVGFDGRDHVLLRDAEVVYEDGAVLYVGPRFPGRVDRAVDAGHALVSPGFVDLDALGDIDHSLFDTWVEPDVMAGLRWSAPYFERGRHELFTRAEQADVRRYALVQLLRGGITTAAPIAAETYRAWAETGEEFADVVDVVAGLGIRAYLGPSYRSGVNVTLEDGGAGVMWDRAAGERGLDAAIAFATRFDGAAGGRVRAMLAPARIETCTTELLARSRAVAAELGCPLRIHAAQAEDEVRFVRGRHGTTPVRLLDRIEALGPRTWLVHARHVDEAEWRLLREAGTSIVHCPLTNVRQGIPGPSLRALVRAGIGVGLGTDTFPPDMVRVMEHAWYLAKMNGRDRAAVSAADVFRMATLGGAAALGRDDLGRLCPGARADVVVFDLSGFHLGPIDDPIRTLLMNGGARDVSLVVVDGRVVVDRGAVPGIDLDALRGRAQELFERYRRSHRERDWRGRAPEELFPPSFREQAAMGELEGGH